MHLSKHNIFVFDREEAEFVIRSFNQAEKPIPDFIDGNDVKTLIKAAIMHTDPDGQTYFSRACAVELAQLFETLKIYED